MYVIADITQYPSPALHPHQHYKIFFVSLMVTTSTGVICNASAMHLQRNRDIPPYASLEKQ